jgi:hypothetical protein
MMSEVGPLTGMATEFVRTPLVVYSSINTGSPVLARVDVAVPTRSTERLPGSKPGVICALTKAPERHEARIRRAFVFTDYFLKGIL